MYNNNETNENVSKVVAEFFKSNPIKQSGNHKHRQYNNRADNHKKADTSETAHTDRNHQKASEAYAPTDTQGTAPHTKEERHNNKNHDKRGYKNNRYDRRDKNNIKRNDEAQPAVVEEVKVSDELFEINEELAADAPVNEQPAKNNGEQSDDNAESNINEWYDPNTPVEIVGVRFKAGGKIYYFAPMSVKASKGDHVIVETARGLEFGTVQTPNTVVKIKDVGLPLKNVIRLATPEDIKHHEENSAKINEALRICNERIAVHNLDMKLVDVEYTFDNTKLLFYFTSEGRVDFRELVKDLAGIFKTRIELRQIGIREETKLLGGIGICGRPFCCKSFLNDFVQVSIKMAKEQGLSLNSAKISGACGRLMCCLRYEYDTYEDEIRKTPKVDTHVVTPDGAGVVCETQPLAGLCKVRLTSDDETVIKVYHRDDLKPAGTSEKKVHGKNEKNQKQEIAEDAE